MTTRNRSTRDYLILGVAGIVALSMCGQTAENMSAGGTAKAATVGGVTAAGAAGAYGCTKVGVRTCLGGPSGGGGSRSDKKELGQETMTTTPPTVIPNPHPEATTPPTAPPATSGSIILPPGVNLDSAAVHVPEPDCELNLGGIASRAC